MDCFVLLLSSLKRRVFKRLQPLLSMAALGKTHAPLGRESSNAHKIPVVYSALGKTPPETPHVLWQTRSHKHHVGHAGHEDLVLSCEDL